MADIHPTAVVEAGARIGEGVSIGPFCCVGPDVEIEAGVTLHAHVVVAGRTRIGADTAVFPFACLGHAPQHQGFRGEPSTLIIGARNIIREYVTMNPGTAAGGMVTRVGNDGFFMLGSHIAHDCLVGDKVIMANNATLGGHVEVGDHVVIGGLSAVHQHVRVGCHAMIGGMSAVVQDVIPFGTVAGDRAALSGLNIIGLKRRGFSRDEIHALRLAYRQLFEGSNTLAERIEAVAATAGDGGPVKILTDFVRQASARSLCLPKTSDAS